MSDEATVHVRLGHELLAAVDDEAERVGSTRAETIRALITAGLPRYPELHNPEWMARHADLSNAEIARMLGCGESTVRRARGEDRPPWPRYPQLQDAEWLRAQRAAGRTQADIAAEVGSTRGAVKWALKQRGI